VVIPPVVTPPVVTPPTTPVKKLWGAYLGYQTTDAATFESLVGAKMNLQALFIHWGNENAFPTQFGPTVRDQNKTLVIFWESDDYNLDVSQETAYTYSKILAGNFDSYIKQFAADAKSYGGPVILVPFDEMNGNWSAWSGTLNGNSASQEIAAYRYLRNFFTADTNVKFAWDVNNDSVPDISGNQISDYYPGDQYVDYLGVDGFNFDSPWQTWSSVFSSSLNTLKAYPKPIYIFSTASSQGTQKAAWITQGLGTDIYNYPQVAGWVWFNENKERDWRVNSDAASLKAFQQIVQ
jgi:beta-mannanase